MTETTEMFPERELNEVFRVGLKISGLPKELRDQFCQTAKDEWNDNYSAYLIYLMKLEKQHYKMLDTEGMIQVIQDDLNEIRELIEDKKPEEKPKGFKNIAGELVN